VAELVACLRIILLFGKVGWMLTDAQWMVLEPLIEACRPPAKVPPQHLRRTISAIVWRHDNGAKWRAVPAELGPWWMAAQTFIRWSRLGVWERLLTLVQEQGVQLGMTFLDGTSIRALQKAAGAAKKQTLRRDGTIVKHWAGLAAALAPKPASSPMP
jgi:transposase